MGKKREFRRPAVTLSDGRRWMTVEATRLAEGDIVQDMGMVKEIRPCTDNALVESLEVRFLSGEVRRLLANGTYKAFTRG